MIWVGGLCLTNAIGGGELISMRGPILEGNGETWTDGLKIAKRLS